MYINFKSFVAFEDFVELIRNPLRIHGIPLDSSFLAAGIGDFDGSQYRLRKMRGPRRCAHRRGAKVHVVIFFIKERPFDQFDPHPLLPQPPHIFSFQNGLQSRWWDRYR